MPSKKAGRYGTGLHLLRAPPSPHIACLLARPHDKDHCSCGYTFPSSIPSPEVEGFFGSMVVSRRAFDFSVRVTLRTGRSPSLWQILNTLMVPSVTRVALHLILKPEGCMAGPRERGAECSVRLTPGYFRAPFHGDCLGPLSCGMLTPVLSTEDHNFQDFWPRSFLPGMDPQGFLPQSLLHVPYQTTLLA
eukprot:Gb_05120 [translate_table: standard]